jgi:hypothetical protein
MVVNILPLALKPASVYPLNVRLACESTSSRVGLMTAAKVIEEILHLPHEEQSRVCEFGFALARKRQLLRKELSALEQRMVASDDPAEVEGLESEITRGFYGQ